MARPHTANPPRGSAPTMHGPVPAVQPDDRGIWRNQSFLLLWLAQAISQTAQNAIWYGVVVLVQHRSNSSTQLSVAVLTLILPSVFFGVVAGVYVDRWDKHRVLVATNLLRGVVAFAYMLLGPGSTLPLVALYAVNFVFSTIGQLFAPAETAMIPVVVGRRRLLQANSLFHLTFTASQLLGLVVLGPLLAKLLGTNGLFLWMAVAIVACGFLVWPLPRSVAPQERAGRESALEAVNGVIADVRAVGRYVIAHRVVALAMVQWTIGAILGLVVATLVPGFAERLLHVDAEDAVFLMAPAGVGMVGGTALLNRWGDRIEKHFLTNVGLSVVAGALMLLGGASLVMDIASGHNPPLMAFPSLGEVSVLVPLVMAGALIAGVGFVAIMVPSQTVLQEHAPVELRGRVFAVQLMLSNLASIVPLLLLGALADVMGVHRTFILIGLLIAGAAAVSVRIAPGEAPWQARADAQG